MAQCYICGCELDSRKTKPEHIIPNGIGGKLKSREILCDKHNNELFELDQVICKDLETHTNRLNPSRDNGKNPSTKCKLPTGEKVILEPDGQYFAEKPNINVNKLEDGKINIQYSTYYSTNSKHKDFALNQLKSITKGVCQKQGFSDENIEKELKKVDELFEKSIRTDFNPILWFQFQFNSSGKLFLGLSKIALDYYFYNKLSTEYVEEFLNKFKEQDIIFINKNANYYYDKVFLTDSIYHTLILKGDKSNGLLYCIISLYGVLNCIVFLNRNYSGDDFLCKYSYDLRNQKEVIFDKNPTIKRDMVENILKSRQFFDEIKNTQEVFMSFFKYGSDKEIKKDLELFEKNVEEEIKLLQKKNIISDKSVFYDKLAEICNNHIQSNNTLKQLTKYEQERIHQEICKVITYEYYLHPFLLQAINKILLLAIEEAIVNNPEVLNDDNKFVDFIYDFYTNSKTSIKAINELLITKKDNIKKIISNFIKKFRAEIRFISQYSKNYK